MHDQIHHPQRLAGPSARAEAALCRPVQVATWEHGVEPGSDDFRWFDGFVSHAEDLAVMEWIREQRSAHPEHSLAVLYDRSAVGAEAVRQETVCQDTVCRVTGDPDSGRMRLNEVLAGLGNRSGGFIGDTTPTSLAGLRRWTERALLPTTVPDDVRDDIILVVDELASNVEEHASGWVTVDVVVRKDHVLVVVSDPHPELVPVPGVAPPDQAHGRGLLVVGALSDRWGLVFGPSSKAVWAEIGWRQDPVADGGPEPLERSAVPVESSPVVESGSQHVDT